MKNRACQFEKEFGKKVFLKASISALNRLLVAKGLITEIELVAEMEKEMKRLENEKR